VCGGLARDIEAPAAARRAHAFSTSIARAYRRGFVGRRQRSMRRARVSSI